jgi:hypothetical protein
MRASHVARSTASSLFVSAKTTAVIPAASDLVRDSLVQATLDPAVRRIDFHAQEALVDAAHVDINAIDIVTDGGRFWLDIVEARSPRAAKDEVLASIALAALGMTPLTLTAEDIRRQPRFANAGLVWSHRLAPVGFSMRMAVLQILSDDGPMPLSRLLSAVRGDRDPIPAVMAMACSDLIEIDLVSRPLGPETIVRARS